MDGHQQQDETLKIFVSHKLIDHRTASKLVSALRFGGAGNVDVKFSGEREHFGRDFREWIKDGVEEAEWYVLAFTDPAKNWDWCLYEAGYFEAAKKEGARLICIYSSDSIPPPLKQFDPVPVNNASALHAFCEKFVKRANPRLSIDETKEAIEDLSHRINDAFLDRIESRYYCRHLTLWIPKPDSLGAGDLPDDAEVSCTREMMSKIFGRHLESANWAELRDSPATRDRRWLIQLVHALKDIYNNRTPQPITGNIEMPDVDENFLPVLCRVDELENHSYECEILLTDGITPRWAALRDPPVRALLTSLRMTVRFRYDILDEFRRVSWVVQRLGSRRFREKFRNLMFDIMTEAEAHGLDQRELLLECFGDREDRAEIDTMFDEWENEIHPRLFSALGMSPDPSVWTKFDDSPLEQGAIREIEQGLTRLREMNTRFLVLALQRFQGLISAGDA